MDRDLINRLVLHLIYQSEIAGRDALKQSEACYENYVENTVEDIFKKYEHYDICVNELEIDLGPVTPEEIPGRLYSALEKELEKYIREKRILPDVSGKIDGAGSVVKTDTDEAARKVTVRYYDNNVSVKEIPLIEDPLSCLLEYLRNPQTPWYLPIDKLFDIEALAGNVFEKCLTDDSHLRQLVSVISQDRRVYHRFGYLIKPDTLDRIICRCMATNSALSDAIYADLYGRINNMLSRYPSYKKEVREWFFESLLYNLPAKKQVAQAGLGAFQIVAPGVGNSGEAVATLAPLSMETLSFPMERNEMRNLLQNLVIGNGAKRNEESTEQQVEMLEPDGTESSISDSSGIGFLLHDFAGSGSENEIVRRLLQQDELLSEWKSLKNKFGKEVVLHLSQQDERLSEWEKLKNKFVKKVVRYLSQQDKLLSEEKSLKNKFGKEIVLHLSQQDELLSEWERLKNKFGKEAVLHFSQQDELLSEWERLKNKFDKEIIRHLSRTYRSRKESFQGESGNSLVGIIPEEKQRYLIHNAGLVIFNPMISTFFRHLGYLDKKGNFKSIRHQIRAVHMLQVLTGIQSKHYDHLLQLNKIICGLDTGFPINPVFRITKREKEETADLLESVLSHWSVLKGTSVSGFQESFVQRDGIMEKNGRGWIVHVENKSIDILLEDLPWSINLLSFPWNDFVIHVEWKR